MTEEKMDVEATDAAGENESSKKKSSSADPRCDAFELLRDWCSKLEKGDVHAIPRLIQSLNKIRPHLSAAILIKFHNAYLSQGASALARDYLTSQLETLKHGEESTHETATGDLDAKLIAVTAASQSQAAKAAQQGLRQGQIKSATPELELYLRLLTLLHLFDRCQAGADCDPLPSAKSLIDRIDQLDKRTHDPFLARAFFYYALAVERKGEVDQLPKYLNSRLRLATLRQQHDSEAALIVSILRSYLLLKNHTAASRFVEKVSFPESANNNEVARFNYYQGRIKALQLEYAHSAKFFHQALRKAPQDSAIGFKQDVQKWIVVVGLLQGEIPERSIFRNPIHRITLAPYLKLTQAVRLGDIGEFNKVLEANAHSFKADETLTLIARLRQNVIRTAIRKIALAYSRISIKDIAEKLQMASEDEAEYVVERAIKDETIDAVLDFDKAAKCRYMRSKETQDVYRTTEPQYSYDSRIRNCLALHNQAVKALRYPSKIKNGDVESIEQQRERELMELEFASEMADDDEEF